MNYCCTSVTDACAASACLSFTCLDLRSMRDGTAAIKLSSASSFVLSDVEINCPILLLKNFLKLFLEWPGNHTSKRVNIICMLGVPTLGFLTNQSLGRKRTVTGGYGRLQHQRQTPHNSLQGHRRNAWNRQGGVAEQSDPETTRKINGALKRFQSEHNMLDNMQSLTSRHRDSLTAVAEHKQHLLGSTAQLPS